MAAMAVLGVASTLRRWLLLTAVLAQSFTESSAERYTVVVPHVAIRCTSMQAMIYVYKGTSALSLDVTLVDPKANIMFRQPAVVPESSGVASVVIQIGSSWPKGTYKLVSKASDGSFNSTARFDVIEKLSTIFIMTDKSIYKPAQIVNFRVIVVSPDLKPREGYVNVSVEDPNRISVARWKDQPLTLGTASFLLPLADKPTLGNWAVIVQSGNQDFTQEFGVIDQNSPRFQTTVSLPSYVTSRASFIVGSVSAIYSSGENVQGTVSLGIFLRKNKVFKTLKIDGRANFTLTLSDLTTLNISQAAYFPIIAQANVTEASTGVIITGSNSVAVYPYDVVITYLPAMADSFKPNQTYRAYIKVNRPDGSLLRNSNVALSLHIYSVYYDIQPGELITNVEKRPTLTIANVTLPIPADGVVFTDVLIPSNILYFTVNSSLTLQGQIVAASFDVGRFSSKGNNSLGIYINGPTEDLKSGSTVSLKVSSAFPVPMYYLLAISRQRIVSYQALPGYKKDAEFSLKLDNSPEVTFVVSAVDRGELLADCVTVPVGGAFANKVNIGFEDINGRNITEARPGDKVRLRISADPNSLVGVLAVDQRVLRTKAPYGLPFGQVLDEIQNFAEDDNDDFPIFFGFTKPRWGCGVSSGHVFSSSKMYVYTDATIVRQPYIDVPDGEITGSTSHPILNDPSTARGISQLDLATRRAIPDTWISDLLKIGDTGELAVLRQVPNNVTTWLANGFSISSKSGLAVAAVTTQLKAFRDLTVYIAMPDAAVLGEQVSLKVYITNNLNASQEVTVSLESCDTYTAKVTSSDAGYQKAIRQTVTVSPNSQANVQFWASPKMLGSVKITGNVTSNGGKYLVEKVINVKSSGISNSYCLTDLQTVSRDDKDGYTRTFNLQYPQAIVAGSKEVRIGISGDVMSPSLQGLQHLVAISTDCGEQTLTGLISSVIIREYLETTGQMTSTWMNNTDSNMLSGYQKILRFYRWDEFFSAFGDADDEGSTWLTAYVLRSLQWAKKYMINGVDTKIIVKAFNSLRSRVNSDGSFFEPGRPIHVEMQEAANSTVALSAYVAIALLEQESDVNISLPKINDTIKFLEDSLPKIVAQPYKIAMVAYALSLSKSRHATAALNMLTSIVYGDNKYSTGIIRRKDANNADKRSKEDKTNDNGDCYYCPPLRGASQVETMAYALLSYMLNGKREQAEDVAKWLARKRSPLGGFAGTQDTVLALQALAGYARLTKRSGSSLAVSVSAEGSSTLSINDGNALQHQILTIQRPEKLKNIKITAKGQGTVLATICTTYNVLNVPARPAVSLNVTVVPTSANLSTAFVSICVFATNDSGSAGGMGIVEVSIPTGFTVSRESITSTNAKMVEYTTNRVSIYFETFKDAQKCGSISMQQTHQVKALSDAFIIAAPYYNYDQKSWATYNPVTGTVTYVNVEQTEKADCTVSGDKSKEKC